MKKEKEIELLKYKREISEDINGLYELIMEPYKKGEFLKLFKYNKLNFADSIRLLPMDDILNL